MAEVGLSLSQEDKILYEILLYSEWQEQDSLAKYQEKGEDTLKKFSSTSSQRSWWNFLSSLSTGPNIPPLLMKLIEKQMTWKFAVGGDGKVVAVLQEQALEIRSSKDEYSTVVGKTAVAKDAFPQWRRLSWSPDCSMIAVSYSNGNVDLYDLIGTSLFTIANPNGANSIDITEALCGLIFTEVRVKKTHWSAELLLCNYKGRLRSYFVSPTDSFQENHSFDFSKYYPFGITCVTHHPHHQLLFVSGASGTNNNINSSTNCFGSSEGITAWRFLSDEPHYKVVLSLEEEKNQCTSKIFMKKISYIWLLQGSQDIVFELSVSPNGTKIAALHTSGAISIWNIPSLKCYRKWNLNEQPGSDVEKLFPLKYSSKKSRIQSGKDPFHSYPVDISWWSEESIILARCSGSVTVSSIHTLTNLLGESCEWFEPYPQISISHDKKFIALECICQIVSKKRAVSEDDDEFEDSSDEEDESFMTKTSKVVKTILYYVTDSERFQPPRKRPKILLKTYQLLSLKSTTPEELYTRKMDLEEYGEALALARAYGLDTDLVYQRQWRKMPVSVATIQDYLSKITKRSWVLHECLERVPENIDAARELLLYGLRGTDLEALIKIGKGEDKGRFILCQPMNFFEDSFDEYELQHLKTDLQKQQSNELLKQVDIENLTIEQKQLCQVRHKLLTYIDRLDTYEIMLGGPEVAAERFDYNFFKNFRNQQAVKAAVEFARSSNWRAVDVLFTYHGSEVLPHRLAILSNFPETTSPYDYRSLLPAAGFCPGEPTVVPWEQVNRREADWCENSEFRAILDTPNPSAEDLIYTQSPELSIFHVPFLTIDLLTTWYIERAKEIERRSCLVDNALQLIKLGHEKNVQGLEELYDDLLTLETLIYECHVDCNLEHFQKLSDIEKVHLLMSNATDETYIKCIRRWLLPFLSLCEKHKSGSELNLLKEFMTDVSKRDLKYCYLICQHSRGDTPSPIIKSVNDLIDIALECVYTCPREDQLSVAKDILDCLPRRTYGPATPEFMKLHDWIEEFEQHLKAALILERHGMPKTIQYIRDCQTNVDECKQLFIKSTRISGRRLPPLTEAEWDDLLKNILELQQIFHCISPSLCYEIFTESLLCSGRNETIEKAGELMDCNKNVTTGFYTKKVNYDRAISLVLNAAKEYFNSSSKLSDPNMILARKCLQLITSDHPDIQAELDLISALSMLKDYGVRILPLQVRLTEDRLQLIEMVLQSKPDAYRFPQRLLKLAHLLRVNNDNRILEGRVLSVGSRKALDEKDYPMCFQLCQQIIQGGHSIGWEICQKLGQCDEFEDLDGRCKLLSFAVTHCTSDQIESLIQARCLLEVRSLHRKLNTQMDFSPDMEDSFVDAVSSPILANDEHAPNWSTPLQQTCDLTFQMFQTTSQATYSALSFMSNKEFWKQSLQWIRPLSKESKQQDLKDTSNNNFPACNYQGCHAFYQSLIKPSHISELGVDYAHYGSPLENRSELNFGLILLRAAMLTETLTQGEKLCLEPAVLIQLAKETFKEDAQLGLSYLLALKNPSNAEECFSRLPSSDIALHAAAYYFALQLICHQSNHKELSPSDIYLCCPDNVIEAAISQMNEMKISSTDNEMKKCKELLQQYYDTLSDLIQAKVLQQLGRGVDVLRFSYDSCYKKETILGLAMTSEDEVYNTAVSLAHRYDVPIWDVFMTHVEFLFADSDLPTRKIEERIKNLGLHEELQSSPDQLLLRLQNFVYPTICGTDHSRLILYYDILSKCNCNVSEPLTVSAHLELLKKVKQAAPGLNYKALIDQDSDPLKILYSELTNENFHLFAKLANMIPYQASSTKRLNASLISCIWMQKLFFYGDQDNKKEPSSTSEWIHRYERCTNSQILSRLEPKDFLTFISGIIFSPKSVEIVPFESRKEIIRRALKFSKSPNKHNGKDGNDDWESSTKALLDFSNHLKWMESELVQELKSKGSDVLIRFLKELDLTQSKPEKVQKLLIQCAIEGNTIDTLQQLISVCPPGINLTPDEVITLAVKYTTEAIKNPKEKEWNSLLQGRPPLEVLQKIINQFHSNEGEEFVIIEDILNILRPICADNSVPVQYRLDILQILEKAFPLETEDIGLLLLYKTQTIIAMGWPDWEIYPGDVDSTAQRQKLFNDVFMKCETLNQVIVLTKLLRCWKPLMLSESCDSDSNPWFMTLTKGLETQEQGSAEFIVSCLKDWPPETPDLDFESTKKLFEKAINLGNFKSTIKIALLKNYKELHSLAVEEIKKKEKLTSEDIDNEILELILQHHLLPSLVTTPIYELICEYILNNQNVMSQSNFSVHTIARELKDAGFSSEAGTLLLQSKSVPRTLQTFYAALKAVKIWASDPEQPQ